MEVTTERLDRLGIIAGVIEDIGLVELIDKRLPSRAASLRVDRCRPTFLLQSRPFFLFFLIISFAKLRCKQRIACGKPVVTPLHIKASAVSCLCKHGGRFSLVRRVCPSP